MATPDLEMLPCPLDWRREALLVLHHEVAEPDRGRLVDRLLGEAECGQFDLQGLWIARQGSELRAVLMTQPLPGRALAVWPPAVPGSRPPPQRIEGPGPALLRRALVHFGSRGLRIAQGLLPPRSRRDARAFELGGMPHVTRLLYQARPTEGRPTDPSDTETSGWTWRPYRGDADPEFEATLARTYLGSLDMPELEGSRSLVEILDGHRGSGGFDSTLWQLGTPPGSTDPGAVIMLAEHADRRCLEVTYLGLVPEARGHGLGRHVVARALSLARGRQPRLTLAADRRNTPAVRLYRRMGLRTFDQRDVYLRVLGAPEA